MLTIGDTYSSDIHDLVREIDRNFRIGLVNVYQPIGP